MGDLCLSLVCYALLCVHSSFEIILKSKRGSAALLLLSYRFFVVVNVLRLFPTVPWVGLHCVVVVVPDHTVKQDSVVVDLLFELLPIVCGGSGFVFGLLCISLCPF